MSSPDPSLRPPRSTPIPGAGEPGPGGPSSAGPLPASSPRPAGGDARPVVADGSTFAGTVTPEASTTTRRRRSRHGWSFWAVALLGSIGPLVGLGVGVWALLQAEDAVDRTQEISDPDLSDRDREALGLADDVRTLFDPTAAPALARAYAAELGEDLRLTEVLIYPDYAFATAQDPAQPTHLDEYQWRSGEVTGPQPEQNDPELEEHLFRAAEVDWALVASLADAAPGVLEVEDGAVSHVIVTRSAFDDARRVVMRVYVTGPRDSGYVEADATTGEVLAAH